MKKMLDVVKLTPLMDLTSGRPEIIVGLIDGPVVMNHPDLAIENIREIYGKSGACAQASSAACMHGTFVAGILCGKRGSLAPAICPGCTLLVRPIFGEASADYGIKYSEGFSGEGVYTEGEKCGPYLPKRNLHFLECPVRIHGLSVCLFLRQ